MRLKVDIQYSGLPGVSKSCVDAVMRLIQFGDKISEARILSCSDQHCILLRVNEYEIIAVKSGFTSGYSGEGPRSFSLVLRLLADYGVEIEEYEVSRDILDRINTSSLTDADVKRLEATRPVQPTRWFDYLWEEMWKKRGQTVWRRLPPVMPYSIIDSRIMDLAIGFFEHPDESLLTGYRRLEDIVRERTGMEEHGQKLFSQAFQGEKANLSWAGISASERSGRVGLFIGAYTAYRNPRAHQEPKEREDCHLAEFLLLNHLYHLEGQAVESGDGG